MRESMLHDLYLGRISPWERERIHTREYSELTQKIDDIEEHFKNLLSSEEYARFTEMQNLHSEVELIEDVELFEYSFGLGALMMIDIFRFQMIERTRK